MDLLIAHHHLAAGGVMRVVANHLMALDAATDRPLRVGLLYDGDDSGLPDLSLTNVAVSRHPVEGIGYADRGDADALVRAVETLPGAPLHVHNHTLGKNPAWTAAVRRLADAGRAMLLQLHDFAEDSRPANYRRLAGGIGDLGATLYPHSPRVHLAVLNGRDAGVLSAAGVPADRLHELPNPVPPPPPPADRGAARGKLHDLYGVGPDAAYWLCPVRGIRRKNVGELCLMAAAGLATTAITLAPENPAERPFYDHWVSVAGELNLPCRFGVGEGLAFAENLAAADRVVTCSVAEGFGMAFLEPWAAGRPLGGRDLPAITADFKAEGLDLSSLTPRVDVPAEWFGAGDYIERLHAAANLQAAAYGRPAVTRAEVEDSYERRLRDGCLDFGDLDEELQTRVIRRVASDADAAELLASRWPADDVPVEANAAVVRDAYGLEATGRRLLSVYDEIAGADAAPVDAADAGRVLAEFQSIDGLRLIRS